MPKKALKPVPEGMNTVTPYLVFHGDCSKAIDLYQKAFGARMLFNPEKSPDGKIMHAMLRIGDSNIMMSDTFSEQENETGFRTNLWLYVEDCDAIFAQAVQAGCSVTMPVEDAFWGDRLGQLQDPFGHSWNIATNKWELSTEEMKQAEEEWMKSHQEQFSKV